MRREKGEIEGGEENKGEIRGSKEKRDRRQRKLRKTGKQNKGEREGDKKRREESIGGSIVGIKIIKANGNILIRLINQQKQAV